MFPKVLRIKSNYIEDVAITMYMWSIIFKEGFYEYFLPNINNRTIVEEIPAETSGLGHSITLSAEVWNNNWKLLENEHIAFEDTESEISLSDNLLVKCITRSFNTRFAIIITEIKEEYSSFDKYRLPEGILNIGRESDNDISVRIQNLVSGRHAYIETKSGICTLVDESRNGTFLNNRHIKTRTRYTLNFGDIVNIFGLKIVILGDCFAINKPTETMALSERLSRYESPNTAQPLLPLPDSYFQRSPRTVMKMDDEPVTIDKPPSPQIGRRQPLLLTIGPALTMVLPMTVGVLFMMQATQAAGGAPSPFLFMGIVTSASAALLGVFWGLTNYRHARKMETQAEETRKTAYTKYLTNIRKVLGEKHASNRNNLNKTYPAAEICFSFTSPKVLHLWERNVNHKDFLTVRLGMGARLALNNIEIGKESFSIVDDELIDEPRKIQEEYKKLRDVPISINLLEHKLVGVIAGDMHVCTKIAYILVAQLAACHSYSDLRMVFLYNHRQTHEYSFAKWLPHVWNEQGSLRMVACDTRGKDEVLHDLAGVVRKRTEEAEEIRERHLPHYVIFVSDPALLEDEPLTKILYDPPESAGLSVILLYGEIGQIPNNCTTIIRQDWDYSGYYSMDDTSESYNNIKFDEVSLQHLEMFTRSLSGFRLREARLAGAIPDKLTFLEMYNAKSTDIDVYRKWLENRTYESMGAVIGYRNADTPLTLDIHEKAHGPHGLVAGTTGSGKSEMLQTYILSLATNFHPHEISFVLIDYKGGGMAQSFADLPHVTGIITNLGGNQTNRALAAIRSEVRRRQMVLSNYSLKHVDEYIEMYRDGGAVEPMPHLLIIADEFAELKKEQSNFVSELISVARVGRSLGVHLILATQKPSASVDDEIQSNSRFRICLRVQDKQDSMDMIRCPDAALITIPGRGYFQVGNNELFESFQSGWSGATYEPNINNETKDDEVCIINLQGKRLSGKHRKKATSASSDTPTQLEAMVLHIKDTAVKNHIRPIAPIWLPPLPTRLALRDDIVYQHDSLAVQIGSLDDPNGQRQFPLILDFLATGHMLVASGSGGGKTTFLQTVLYSLVTAYTPEQVNLYIVDMGSRNLGVFSQLPHTGGVAFDSDIDKINKLVSMLVKEVGKRKLLFSDRGIGTFKEYRQEVGDLPAIILVIDNYAAFSEGFTNHEETLISLSRDAASFGVYITLSCVSAKEVRGRLRQNINFGVGIQLGDRFEYEDVIGARTEFVPDDNIPGRGLVRIGADVLEFQTALCVDEPNASKINATIREHFNSIKTAWQGKAATQIPQVPDDLSIGAVAQIPAVKSKIECGRFIPLGYDFAEAVPVFVDLGTTFCYTISGAERTGKTMLLKALMLQASKQGAACYIFDSPDEELRKFAHTHAKGYITTSDELFSLMSSTLVPEFQRRNKGKEVFMQNEQRDLDKYIASEQKLCLFINNMDAFCEAVYNSEKEMKGFIEQMLTKGDGHMIYLFACVAVSDMMGEWGTRPVFRKFTGRKDGIHLGGAVDNQRIFDFEIPVLDRGKRLSPGEGHIIENGFTKRVITVR